jgi:outer membrane protein assembly factor BamB
MRLFRWMPVGLALLSANAFAADWLSWRGPHQDGRTDEAAPSIAGPALWSVDLMGRGTPVVAGDRVFVWGYEGAGESLSEVLASYDLVSGRELWKHRLRDFLSDTVYERYSLGAPTVDPETGNVYLLSSAGVLGGWTRDGAPLWQVSTGEMLGRMTFPNGKVGAPLIVDDLAIIHVVTANWGREGAARDRLYAFDKRSGQLVWSSTPGTQPQDNSWTIPWVAPQADGRVLLYVSTGCGHLAAVDAHTGDPVFRAPMAKGGVVVNPVLSGNLLIAAHAMENLDSTKTGGMFAFDVTSPLLPAGEEGAPVLAKPVWRNDISAATSSPVLADGVLYEVAQTGELYAVDPTSGAVLWVKPLGPDQLHASPVWAAGHLYVPMSSGHFFDLKVDRAGATVVSDITLDGQPLGAPSIAWGRVLVHTTKHLYAFGNNDPITAWKPVLPAAVQAGPPARLRVRPAEVILRPGESAAITVDVLDAQGRFIRNAAPASVSPWIPPTAKVKSEMKAVWKDGRLTAPLDAGLTAGAFQVKVGDLVGTFRGRTVSGVPYAQDFEGFAVTEIDPVHPDQKFAWPPLPWIGARFKWDVRERDGSKVLAKTLDKVLFQRALTFVGHPDERDYTMQVDLMSDGDSRQMSAVGVIHQRYIIAVKGNQRNIEVSSNQERLKRSVPFEMLPGVWYRMVTRVSVNADGVAHIQAKVWPRAEPEPTAWTLDIEHAEGHPQGAPGLFGFTPRNLHPVFVDNLVITPNAGAAR